MNWKPENNLWRTDEHFTEESFSIRFAGVVPDSIRNEIPRVASGSRSAGLEDLDLMARRLVVQKAFAKTLELLVTHGPLTLY